MYQTWCSAGLPQNRTQNISSHLAHRDQTISMHKQAGVQVLAPRRARCVKSPQLSPRLHCTPVRCSAGSCSYRLQKLEDRLLTLKLQETHSWEPQMLGFFSRALGGNVPPAPAPQNVRRPNPAGDFFFLFLFFFTGGWGDARLGKSSGEQRASPGEVIVEPACPCLSVCLSECLSVNERGGWRYMKSPISSVAHHVRCALSDPASNASSCCKIWARSEMFFYAFCIPN